MQKQMNLAVGMGTAWGAAADDRGDQHLLLTAARGVDFAVMFDVRAGMSGVSR